MDNLPIREEEKDEEIEEAIEEVIKEYSTCETECPHGFYANSSHGNPHICYGKGCLSLVPLILYMYIASCMVELQLHK